MLGNTQTGRTMGILFSVVLLYLLGAERRESQWKFVVTEEIERGSNRKTVKCTIKRVGLLNANTPSS